MFQSALIFFNLPTPLRAYSLLGSLLAINFYREETYSLWVGEVVGRNGWTLPVTYFLPSGTGSCLVTEGSQLFYAELQKDRTTIEVEMHIFHFFVVGRPSGVAFFAHVLVVFIFNPTGNLIENFLRSETRLFKIRFFLVLL